MIGRCRILRLLMAWDAFNNYHMGVTAENIAKQYEISREEQDAFAATSQQKTKTAQNAGKFDDEIVPIEIPQRKGVNRLGTSEEVAALVDFLCSDKSGFTTGADFAMNGRHHMM